jgi:hypothetical protein
MKKNISGIPSLSPSGRDGEGLIREILSLLSEIPDPEIPVIN